MVIPSLMRLLGRVFHTVLPYSDDLWPRRMLAVRLFHFRDLLPAALSLAPCIQFVQSFG